MKEFGPCRACGTMYLSRSPRKYCSMACYQSSPELKERLRSANPRLGRRQTIGCAECGAELNRKLSESKGLRFCNSSCYRKYLTKRFDRYVANPTALELPQNYDEFLTSEVLPCLIDGCDWRGHRLSFHMNIAHGIRAREFKKIAGFNIQSGIISEPERQAQRATALKHPGRNIIAGYKGSTARSDYRSREGVEHSQKSRAIRALSSHNPNPRQCPGCGAHFSPISHLSTAQYCSVECREAHYNAEYLAKKHSMTCVVCNTNFLGDRSQLARVRRGLPVVCSMTCRQHRAAKLARGTWSAA